MSKGRYEGVISKDKVIKIITQDDPQLLVSEADQAGEQLAGEKLTKNQIRNIFGTVRQIQLNWPLSMSVTDEKARVRELLLLKPKLAYQARRERGKGVEILNSVLSPAIDFVEDNHERFQNFVDFFEAILAYHTAAGGQ